MTSPLPLEVELPLDRLVVVEEAEEDVTDEEEEEGEQPGAAKLRPAIAKSESSLHNIIFQI